MPPSLEHRPSRVLEVFSAFLGLGFTAFGGPITHLAYFRETFVVRRRWLDERAYADLVALCQALPGPASSQVGMALGLMRAGGLGLIAAWVAFTAPSALLMGLAAVGAVALGDQPWQAGLILGLKAAAVAVVAQAVWGMAKTLWNDHRSAALGVTAAFLVVAIPGVLGQLAALVLGLGIGFLGERLIPQTALGETPHIPLPFGRRAGAIFLILFCALLVALPVLATMAPDILAVRFADSVYRAGALVFGGGHVVLPLLQAEIVGPGWVDKDVFLAGYGLAQAVPGPLFTFSAYLGVAAGGDRLAALALAGLAVVMLFLPGALVLVGSLPFWNALRTYRAVRGALSGLNAAVTGILLAALYDPVFTAATTTKAGFPLILVAALLLIVLKLPPWLGVLLTGACGALYAALETILP